MSPEDLFLPPYIRQADEHERLGWAGGQELAVVTGGQLSVIDVHARRSDASPVHDDEAFLLLDGP